MVTFAHRGLTPMVAVNDATAEIIPANAFVPAATVFVNAPTKVETDASDPKKRRNRLNAPVKVVDAANAPCITRLLIGAATVKVLIAEIIPANAFAATVFVNAPTNDDAIADAPTKRRSLFIPPVNDDAVANDPTKRRSLFMPPVKAEIEPNDPANNLILFKTPLAKDVVVANEPITLLVRIGGAMVKAAIAATSPASALADPPAGVSSSRVKIS